MGKHSHPDGVRRRRGDTPAIHPSEAATDVLPVYTAPRRRVGPAIAGVALAGTIATGIAVAPQIGSDDSIPVADALRDASPALTPDEAIDQLAEVAASRNARAAEQHAAIQIQEAAEATALADRERAAQEAQDAAEAAARAQEAQDAAEALQEATVTAAEAYPAIATITNSAGPVSARVQAAANAVVSNVAGADSITLGGTRSSAIDPDGHPSGNALDYMVGTDSDLGDAIVAYHIAHWDALGVEYIIWEQRILTSPGGSWEAMEDRGGTTANHYDHPHVNYLP